MTQQGGPRYGANDDASAPECPRHRGRPAYASCGRCGRPACADCLVPAPVGMRCRDCVHQDARSSRGARTVFGADYRGETMPVVTYALIGLCALLWIAQWASDRVTDDLVFVPAIGLSEPWRFLTSAFIHMPRNPSHILFNMFALWQVGRALEPMLGRARYLALYLLSGLAGSVAMVVAGLLAAQRDSLDPWFTGSLGASGAVFGLFGAYFVAGRKLQADTSWVIGLLVINVAMTLLMPSIAWEAHLGGLVTGAGIMALLAATARGDRRRLQWPLLGAVLLLLAAVTSACYAAFPYPNLIL